MRKPTGYFVVVGLFFGFCQATAGCGPGKYGSAVEVCLQGGVGAAESGWDSGQRRLAVGGPMYIEVDRACLVVGGADDESVSVTVLPDGSVVAGYGFSPPGTGVFKEECFCHGNPPHCHGDCDGGEGGTSSTAQPVSGTVRTGVDLMDPEPRTILSGGAAPGDYAQVLMTLGRADSATFVPQDCGDMADRTFFLQGRLVNEQTSDSTELTVDIRVSSRVTEPLQAASAAVAEPGKSAVLRVVLLLDVALSNVDWVTLGCGSAGPLLVGGETQSQPVAVSEIVAGLGDQASYTVESLN